MSTLELDMTAAAPENYIPSEERVLSPGSVRIVVPSNGYFYDKDLVITNADTGQPLGRAVDYVLQHPIDKKIRTPYEAYLIIAIINPSVSRITFNYRAVGGWYALTTEAIGGIISSIGSGGTYSWGNIYDLPKAFFPVPHMHHASDIDFGSLIYMMERLTGVLEMSQSGPLTSMYAYIDQMTNNFEFYGSITDVSWGAIREKITGFTLNWGKMPVDTGPSAQGLSGARYQTNFKKAFSQVTGTPILLPGGSLGKYSAYEEESSDEDGFIHVVKYDSSNPTTAVANRHYFAIGLSSVDTPISNTHHTPL